MKCLIKYVLVFIPIIVSAQKKSDVYKVAYSNYNNGEKSKHETEIFFHEQLVYLSKNEDKIQQYINLDSKENISLIEYNGQTYGLITPFDELPVPTLKDDLEEILGYKCKHVSYSYFSNKIDVWYTEETKAKGTPYNKYLPNSNALVLKIVTNNNREIRATAITKAKGQKLSNKFDNATLKVSDDKFEEIKINSRYHRLEIFKDEIVNFDNKIIPPQEATLNVNQTYHFSKGSVVMKKIKLTPELKNSGYVFAKLHCKSNGDAYDRTGSVFIIPTKKDSVITMLHALQYGLDQLPVYTDNEGNNYQGIVRDNQYIPPIEIMRFFTSFGADHFNEKRKINNYDWANDVLYKQDVSSLIPSYEDEFWVGVFVGNYDSGGHIVSLELDFYPAYNSEEENEDKKYIQPLFSNLNIMEMEGQNYGRLFGNDTLRGNFEIPADIQKLQLLYTSTGHGGWGGGDEFNPKLNQIFIDGEEVFKIIPWRTDCATYRLSNPASGNFRNGLSSSDLSRSNWCPATVTPPYIVSLDSLKEGKHMIEVVIDQGENDGSSFSHWSISGVLVGEIPSNDDSMKEEK